MIHPDQIDLKEKQELESLIKKLHPNLVLDWSPAFRHYYIIDKNTKEKSDNISYYELKVKFMGR